MACAYASPEDGSLGGCATTDSVGEYTIDLNPHGYTVVFEGVSLSYARQWYDHAYNHPERATVMVGSNPVTGVDAEMEPFGRIEGAVREDGSGIPVDDTRVCAWEFDGSGYGRCAWTDASGGYVIADVPPDEYVVEFWPRSSNHLWQYYDHKERREEADPVLVGLSEVVTGVDADVLPAAGVEGVVRRADNNAPFAELFVHFWPLDKETFWPARPNEDGSFSIVGMPPGDYKVEFLPYSSKWETQFWDDKASWEEAATLSLTAGNITTGIDADLVRVPPALQPQMSPPPSLAQPSLLNVPLALPPPPPPPTKRLLCPNGFRKKRIGSKVQCVRKHKRHHQRQRLKQRNSSPLR
jgi:hypothetical protein